LYYSHGVQYFIRELYPSLLDNLVGFATERTSEAMPYGYKGSIQLITPQEREIIKIILPDSPMLFVALNDQSPAQRVLTRFVQELSVFNKCQAGIYPLVISSVYIDYATYGTITQVSEAYQRLIGLLPEFFDGKLPAIMPAAYTEMQNFHG
jgi:hypothetical protein